jgi:hypothetical protein
MFNNSRTKKTSPISKIVKTVSFVSFSLLIIRLGFLGKLDPFTIAILFFVLVCVFTIGKRFLYAVLSIISFVLFIKLFTTSTNEEWSVYTSLFALFLVLAVIYKIIKNLFK